MDQETQMYIRKMPAVISFVTAMTVISIAAKLIGSGATQSLGLTPA